MKSLGDFGGAFKWYLRVSSRSRTSAKQGASLCGSAPRRFSTLCGKRWASRVAEPGFHSQRKSRARTCAQNIARPPAVSHRTHSTEITNAARFENTGPRSSHAGEGRRRCRESHSLRPSRTPLPGQIAVDYKQVCLLGDAVVQEPTPGIGRITEASVFLQMHVAAVVDAQGHSGLLTVVVVAAVVVVVVVVVDVCDAQGRGATKVELTRSAITRDSGPGQPELETTRLSFFRLYR